MPTMVPVATIIVPPLCLLLTLALQFHKMEVQCPTIAQLFLKTLTYTDNYWAKSIITLNVVIKYELFLKQKMRMI